MLTDPFSFKTIAGPCEGLYREKGSRFLAFAFPVSSEAEIKEHLGKLQKKYFDARHHCYAWRLGPDGSRFRAFDDGEPNHSAGDPILGQIRSKELTNILVVVVRYFGGVKLGVGGLIAAYKTAADDALSSANVVQKEVTRIVHISYDYGATPEVMRLIKDFDLEVLSQAFESACDLTASYKLRNEEKLAEKLELMKATGIKLTFRLDVASPAGQ